MKVAATSGTWTLVVRLNSSILWIILNLSIFQHFSLIAIIKIPTAKVNHYQNDI